MYLHEIEDNTEPVFVPDDGYIPKEWYVNSTGNDYNSGWVIGGTYQRGNGTKQWFHVRKPKEQKLTDGFVVEIAADSICPQGHRLTTFICTYPRFIHSEIMTHREFSRNAASSRAIPIEKMIQRVIDNPVVPIHWGLNQKGMQAESVVDPQTAAQCQMYWLRARDEAVQYAKRLNSFGIHKQIVNRLLEPFMWMTTIISTTNMQNFFALRCHKDAEPHFQKLAYMMRDVYDSSNPRQCRYGDWHTPLTGFEGDNVLTPEELRKVSVGRCARVSYLTHDGKRDVSADLALFTRLEESRHLSPFEHVAMCTDTHNKYGNFIGWKQMRKFIPNECVR
jgi:thymidylate synthase ThyX